MLILNNLFCAFLHSITNKFAKVSDPKLIIFWITIIPDTAKEALFQRHKGMCQGERRMFVDQANMMNLDFVRLFRTN